MEKVIVHVSEVDISPNSGMGRVEYYWEQAIKKAGYGFIHIGPKEVGRLKHKAFFPLKAYQYFKKIKADVVAIIVHEPLSMFFVNKGIPVFIESHGVERRGWEEMSKNDKQQIGIKTRLLYPLWRLLPCDIGLKKANKLLLINNDDKNFVIDYYGRLPNDIYVFKNGVTHFTSAVKPMVFTVLFNGSWLERKGIATLVEAAIKLDQQGISIQYLLIGTGKTAETVLGDWPERLRKNVTVIPRFDAGEELGFLSKATIVVLPSNFEGQPLSILQAMAAGKCCVTTNSCGQKDFIENGKNGLLFEKKEAAELAALIEKCYRNPSLVQAIEIEAAATMKNRSWEETSGELVEYLQKNIEPAV